MSIQVVPSRVHGGLFAPFLADVNDALLARGYSDFTRRAYLLAIGQLGRVASQRHLRRGQATERQVRRLAATLVSRTLHGNVLRASVEHLLPVLRSRGFVRSDPTRRPAPYESILHAFSEHMLQERGVASTTVQRVARDVRGFLDAVVRSGRGDLSNVPPARVREFVVGIARESSPRNAKQKASSIRTFLRFMQMNGVETGTLAAAVPIVRCPKISGPPRHLSPQQVRALLRAFTRTTPKGRRDYAMALCMADLALRAGEVAELRLSDVSWREATLFVRSRKSPDGAALPVPKRVGRAIAGYLTHGRPNTSCNRLFVRHGFPRGSEIRGTTVAIAMREAAERADLGAAWRGTHMLRHTVATRLAEREVPLKQIADVLRHRSIDTTSIYARVDVHRLASAALPWTGAHR